MQLEFVWLDFWVDLLNVPFPLVYRFISHLLMPQSELVFFIVLTDF